MEPLRDWTPIRPGAERETDLAWNAENRQPTREEIIVGTSGRDVLLCNIKDEVDAGLLKALPGLKGVVNFGVGVDNIELAAATSQKIPVTNTPGVLTDATADMAFALLLAVARRVGEGDRMIRSGKWDGWNPMQMLGTDVSGATLGLIGFGRIGQAMAGRGNAFGMNVIYWNRTPLGPGKESAMKVASATLEELLQRSDFVSIHVAYTPETHHLIGVKELALMKESAFVINTARGSVMDESALVLALKSEQIGGAGLDVFEKEPEMDPSFFELENVVLAPHLGSATVGTRTKMGMIAVDNLMAICAGVLPPNCVNPESMK